MRKLAILLVTLGAACLPGDTLVVGETTTTPPPEPTTTTTSTTTTSTSLPEVPVPITGETPLEAAFVVTQVVFGDHGYVEITNYGASPGHPGGYWLLQEPFSFELPALELQAGDSFWVAVGEGEAQRGAIGIDTVAVVPARGAIGELVRDRGEMALYRRPSFDDPAAIVSFVEWGEAGQGRSAVAVEAGVWPEGGLVDTTPDAFGIRVVQVPPRHPDDWIVQVGG